jgi:hypothetical protein
VYISLNNHKNPSNRFLKVFSNLENWKNEVYSLVNVPHHTSIVKVEFQLIQSAFIAPTTIITEA